MSKSLREATNGLMDEASSVVLISETHLDRECIRLPQDFLKYSLHAAELRREVNEAEAFLDVTEAEVAKECRDTPGKFGLEKPTDSAVKAAVVCDLRVKDAQSKVHRRKHDLDMMNSVVSALDLKKRSLTELVNLHTIGYFSDVKLSKQGKEAVQTMTQEAVRNRKRGD
jgi:hypothetical protein